MQYGKIGKQWKCIVCFFLTVILCLSTISFSSFAVEFTIDNDDAQGYSNSRVGYNTYMEYSYLYLGDARKNSTGNRNDYYHWIYPQLTASRYLAPTLSVYLNHNDFTDPQARYYVNVREEKDSGFSTMHLLGTINQHLAPGGWNTFQRVAISYPSNIYTDHVVLLSYSGSGYNTGADGIKIVF